VDLGRLRLGWRRFQPAATRRGHDAADDEGGGDTDDDLQRDIPYRKHLRSRPSRLLAAELGDDGPGEYSHNFVAQRGAERRR
jgi:hypothetical protein